MKIIRFVLLILIFSISITALYGQEESKVKVTRIKGNVYKFFINDFVNIFALVGDDGVLLVDTGFGENAQEVKSKLKSIGSDKVKYIINTHSDYDHIAANRNFREDAVIISHHTCREQLMIYSVTDDIPFDKEIFKEAVPDIIFEEKITLFFNDEEIELIYLPGAHTDEDVIVYFKNLNVACMGDIFIPKTFPVVKLNNGGKIEKVVETIDNVKKIFPDDVIFVFGHGDDYTKNDLTVYRDMVSETIETVKKAKNEGKTLEQMKKENILKNWMSWSGTVFEDGNCDLWIETIYNGILK